VNGAIKEGSGRKAAVLDRVSEEWFAGLEAVKDEIGVALSVAQFGGKHPSAKPWKGEGAGVLEIVEDHRGDTYRAVYTVKFENAAYVLHAFQKKSPKGIKTAQTDVELVSRRLKVASEDYEARFGKRKK
jgi:phage-related protein